MEERKNKITITVFGQQYMITGNESVEHLQDVADKVAEILENIRKQFPNLDAQRISILTAVNVVHEKILLEQKIESLSNELKKIRSVE